VRWVPSDGPPANTQPPCRRQARLSRPLCGLQIEAEAHNDWVEVQDRHTGEVWYYNPTTGKSQWERPPKLATIMSPPHKVLTLPAVAKEDQDLFDEPPVHGVGLETELSFEVSLHLLTTAMKTILTEPPAPWSRTRQTLCRRAFPRCGPWAVPSEQAQSPSRRRGLRRCPRRLRITRPVGDRSCSPYPTASLVLTQPRGASGLFNDLGTRFFAMDGRKNTYLKETVHNALKQSKWDSVSTLLTDRMVISTPPRNQAADTEVSHSPACDIHSGGAP
jgi:hypothetical protein